MGSIRTIILGCGSSGGVPRVGMDWGVCDPENPRNRRTRCGILIQIEKDNGESASVLIDTPPELREQLVRNEVRRVDSVLYTHTHADQCHGIDDLRALCYVQRARMPIYASQASFDELFQRFSYCFKTPEGSPYPPILDARPPVEAGREFVAEGANGVSVDVLPLDQDHGSMRSLGFRIGDVAYCNDVVDLPEESLEKLYGLDLLVVDALRYDPHPTHAHVGKALGWINRLKPQRAVLTNLHVDLDYEALSSELPAHVEPAYDGMMIETFFP